MHGDDISKAARRLLAAYTSGTPTDPIIDGYPDAWSTRRSRAPRSSNPVSSLGSPSFSAGRCGDPV
jgi:hypothetical protein